MRYKEKVLELYPNAHVIKCGPLYCVISYANRRPGIEFFSQGVVNRKQVWSIAWKEIQKYMLRKLES